MSNYYWIRVFDYIHNRDSNYESESYGKGVMLDEFYLKDVIGGRDAVKQFVKERYSGQSSASISFAKPRNKNGMYAIVMESNQFFYDRFYTVLDTFCFWHNCHKPIKGKISEFPKSYIGEEDSQDKFVHFCSYECKQHFDNSVNPWNEGEFQEKEEGENGNIYGYIYLIYNRAEDTYYIGQTRFMPFFRWQEHVKCGGKGDIKDLTFSVLTEVSRNKNLNEISNQEYLNSIEAWWIAKFKEEGNKVFNIANPKITIEYLKKRFDEMVSKNRQLSLSTDEDR
ncbi:hypothetical protein REC12_11365 [Desulfosporosinus sp. PR]|uniref:hypothetical protein n=1 Tax=Candidatus Desulfosporosinus nitrosoreducens TaxID=3401928 RepID=UPI0027F63EED|nr:hypothetical protein [Desulfosporosinus sp. PR]MDQ7094188.1 hypothetical protein [Desulfosporosinus sp. PR]